MDTKTWDKRERLYDWLRIFYSKVSVTTNNHAETGVSLIQQLAHSNISAILCLSRMVPLTVLAAQSETLHRAACRVVSGRLFSAPIPVLFIEIEFPPFGNYFKILQALSCFVRALRLPPEWFNLSALASKPMISHSKSTLLEIVFSIHGRTPFILARAINFMSPNPPWTQPSSKHHPPSPTVLALAYPGLSSLRIVYSLFPIQTSMYEQMDMSFPLRTRGTKVLQMQCFRLPFLLCRIDCLQFHSWNSCSGAQFCMV